MEKCIICGAGTLLREWGVPICINCDEEQEQKRKETAVEKTKQATSPFAR